MAESSQSSRQRLIKQCLTDIDPYELEDHDRNCWICHQAMLPSQRVGDAAAVESQQAESPDPCIPGTTTDESMRSTLENEKTDSDANTDDLSAVKIACGHTFCRSCISKWLSLSSTCPECRATVVTARLTVLEEWQEDRDAIIHNTTMVIRDESQSTWLPALRLRDFVMRETSRDELPNRSMWGIVTALQETPWAMTNEWVELVIEGMDRKLRENLDLPEESRRDIRRLQSALALDLLNHSGLR